MPQMSFEPKSVLHRLRIELAMDEVNGGQVVTLLAENRFGDVIASSSSRLTNFDEAELLPLFLSQVAYGWLYADAREAVSLASKRLRESRKALAERKL
jgi:hypothetical protein